MTDRLTRLQKIIVYALPFLLFVVFVLNNKEQSKILSYVEAQGTVDTFLLPPVVGWVAHDKIIYGINSKNESDTYQGVKSNLGYDFVNTKQVSFFNLVTNNTELYRKGQLVKYENGEVTIRLGEFVGDEARASDNKRVLLSGQIGSEKQATYYISNPKSSLEPINNPPPDKCPTDNINGERYQAMLLKIEHGCVRIPDIYTKDRRWIYFRADGRVIELMNSPEIYFWRPVRWIDWLGAYLLGDENFMYVQDGVAVSPLKLKLLMPDGRFSLINLGEMVQHARPTRAGMVAAINSGSRFFIGPLSSGLRIWRNGKIYKITEGTVLANEVSPDGCKLAYVAVERSILRHKNKLRVIDVCEAFGVTSDANPF